jgi:ElaA protein
MPVIAIHELSTAAEIERAIAIRLAVFVAEQGVSMAQEIDGLDDQARHLLASVDGEPAGTLRIRLLEDGRVAKIERVAVVARLRQQRIGLALMEAALELVRAQGVREVRLHAQTIVQGFYERQGFMTVGDVFVEDGIDHIAMALPLTGRP